MSVNFEVLKSEIANDPSGLGYKNAPSNKDIISSLLNPDVPVQIPVTTSKFIHWALQFDAIRKIEAHAQKDGQARALLFLINSPTGINLDLSDPDIKGIFDSLVSAGVFKQEEVDALASGSTILKSRAEILGLTGIGEGDIKKVISETSVQTVESIKI